MMRFLKQRRETPTYYDARSQHLRVIESHRVKRCGVCTFEVPEADVVVEDGREVCPLCQDTLTAEWLAAEQERVASVKEESARRLVIPPQLSIRALQESRPAAVTSITDSAGNALSQTAPLIFRRNVATTALVKGRYLTTSVTFTYGAGMSNNSTPSVNATGTQITLSIISTTAGNFSLTINDGVSTYGHTYTNIFAVR